MKHTHVTKYSIQAPVTATLPAGVFRHVTVYAAAAWWAIETAVAYWAAEHGVVVPAGRCVALMEKT
jgi:hypothetical protein